jgi:hypothetical protein
MSTTLFYRIYKKNKLEWDDPANSSIYFIPISEITDYLIGYRYTVTVGKGFLNPQVIKLESPFFHSDYSLVQDKTQLILNIEEALSSQIRESKEAALRMVSFGAEFRSILDKIN